MEGDAHYQGGGAVVACVVAHRWTDALPSEERVVTVPAVLPYRPGAFSPWLLARP